MTDFFIIFLLCPNFNDEPEPDEPPPRKLTNKKGHLERWPFLLVSPTGFEPMTL